MLRAAAVVAGVIGIAASAHAQPQYVDTEDPLVPFRPPSDVAPAPKQPAPLPGGHLRVDFGMASPVGFLGAVYSRPIGASLAIEAGAGLGLTGLVLSAMPKLYLGSGRTRFTPGVGLSVSIPLGGDNPTLHTGHPAGDDEAAGDPITMPWLDADLLGVEHRTAGGFVVAASAGLTFPLRRAHWDAIDLGGELDRFSVVPQVRFGIGHEL